MKKQAHPDCQQDGVNDAELNDAGNPEILDAVVEAKLALQRIDADRIGPEHNSCQSKCDNRLKVA